MTYSETLTWLYNQLPMYQRIGAAAYKANLDNTISLCNLLENPQNHFRSIHIAGTNGKGSVAHMLASILQYHGLKTGLYTSPHFKDFRERIRINGQMLSEEEVVRFVEKHRKFFEDHKLSFFEMTAGLAFEHFRKECVDIAVIEVGMGGRLDSTNIITPLISVITNISYDHQRFLGDTLEKIAKEKAGIMKKGIPVVIGETQPELEKLFREQASNIGCPITFADQHPTSNIQYPISSIQPQSPTHYYQKNQTTTLEVIHQLNEMEFAITPDEIQGGMENLVPNTDFMGRWQVLQEKPLIICDAGHNEAGITEVTKQIDRTPYHHLHIVFGMVNDKAAEKILTLLPKEATYYFCKADIPRGLDAVMLRNQANAIGLNGDSYASVSNALNAAKSYAGPDDMIFIGGSTFVVAQVIP